MQPNENDKAAEELAAEKGKFGFKPIVKGKEQGENSDLNDDESEDKGDLDEENTDEEESEEEEEGEESEDESEDEESEEDDEEEEEEEDTTPKKKKGIPFKTHNKLRKELGEAQKQLKKALADNAELEAKLPDDYEERVKALAAEIGVSDPENLTKLMNLAKDASKGEIAQMAKKLADLEKLVQDKTAVSVTDEFPTEWDAFEKDFFTKEFPNATADQLKSARKVMETLAKTKNVGGKAYIDEKSGKEVLDPYPLDYIFYKNRKQFEGVVTGKKIKGMESARTQGIKLQKDTDGEIQHLPKNAKASDVRALDKKYAQVEAGSLDGLRTPENNSI